MPRYEIKLEPIAEVTAYVSAPIPVGPSSWGTRVVFPLIEGGVVSGPKLNGKIRAFGADWGLVRPDNCFELDVRLLIETDDGADIHTYYNGVIDMTRSQAEQFLGGDLPAGLSLFTTPRFETGHENYQWLTRIQAVGRGGVEADKDRFKVTYSWYAVTS